MWFDARAALRKLELQPPTPATSATSATPAPKTRSHVARVADVAAPIHPNHPIPVAENTRNRTNSTQMATRSSNISRSGGTLFEFDGGLTRADAEHLAARGQGYENVVAFRVAQEKHNERKDK